MKSYKTLLDVIEKESEDISCYLEDVTVEQFKEDVLILAKMNVSEYIISDAIDKLRSIL